MQFLNEFDLFTILPILWNSIALTFLNQLHHFTGHLPTCNSQKNTECLLQPWNTNSLVEFHLSWILQNFETYFSLCDLNWNFSTTFVSQASQPSRTPQLHEFPPDTTTITPACNGPDKTSPLPSSDLFASAQPCTSPPEPKTKTLGHYESAQSERPPPHSPRHNMTTKTRAITTKNNPHEAKPYNFTHGTN